MNQIESKVRSVSEGRSEIERTKKKRTNSRVSEDVLNIVSEHHLMEDLSSSHSNEPTAGEKRKKVSLGTGGGGLSPGSRNFICLSLSCSLVRDKRAWEEEEGEGTYE